MSLSLPIINNIITEKIISLNNTVDNNDAFYKTCILNLSSQMNILIQQNTELNNRLECLENPQTESHQQKLTEKKIVKSEKLNGLNCIDNPPGLPRLTKLPVTKEDDIGSVKWSVVKRNKNNRRTNKRS